MTDPSLKSQYKPGETVMLYSSVGAQAVTILETDLTVKNPFNGDWTDRMLIVMYSDGGQGMAHEYQVRRIELEQGK
jgi:hypothetical protein